jgi:hypothetical protein
MRFVSSRSARAGHSPSPPLPYSLNEGKILCPRRPLLNLTHYDSSAVPAPAEPAIYSVHVQLNHVAHAL